MKSSEVFAQSMRECAEAFAPHVEWSLTSVLLGEDEGRGRGKGSGGRGSSANSEAASLEHVPVLQPVLFAMMVSLARVWGACGVRPDAVVGHSQGEIAAALLAGGLSIAGRRATGGPAHAELLLELLGAGWMASVALGVEELAAGRLERWGERIVIAAMNGPSASVVSGERKAIEELLAECEAEGIRARGIAAALGAGHSPQVDALRERMLAAFAPVVPRAGCDSVPLDAHRRAAEHLGAGRRALVPQCARDGALHPGGARAAGGGALHVHRGQPPSGADGSGAGDNRGGGGGGGDGRDGRDGRGGMRRARWATPRGAGWSGRCAGGRAARSDCSPRWPKRGSVA